MALSFVQTAFNGPWEHEEKIIWSNLTKIENIRAELSYTTSAVEHDGGSIML